MTIKQWLQQGPFTLNLSAGFFGFYSHCGFLKAFWDQGLTPQKFAGASAGALVSSLVCAGLTPYQIEEIFLPLRKKDFWDLKLGFGLLEGVKFDQLLQKYLPTHFESLKIPLAVSAFEVKSRKTVSFQKGELIATVRASCCFPFMFHPVKIKGRRHIDGGVADWLAVKAAVPEDRILIHMLEPQGFMSGYMKKWALSQVKHQDHRVVVFPEPIIMGPHKMHLAKDAIEKSYQLTLKLLDEPFK